MQFVTVTKPTRVSSSRAHPVLKNPRRLCSHKTIRDFTPVRPGGGRPASHITGFQPDNRSGSSSKAPPTTTTTSTTLPATASPATTSPTTAATPGQPPQPAAPLSTRPLNLNGLPLTRDEERSLRAAATALGLPQDSGPAAAAAAAAAAGGSTPSASHAGASRVLLSPEQYNAAQAVLARGVTKSEKDLKLLEGVMLLLEQAQVESRHLAGGAAAATPATTTTATTTTTSSSSSSNDTALSEIPTDTRGRSQPPAPGVLSTSTSSSPPPSVGVWQPIFASAGGVSRLLYIPVPEYFDLRRAHEGVIDIITELGPLVTHFYGTCSWEGPHALHYHISSLQIHWGTSNHLLTLPFKLTNTLTFFHTSPQQQQQQQGGGSSPPLPLLLGCARSKLGGTMLLAPNPPGAGKY